MHWQFAEDQMTTEEEQKIIQRIEDQFGDNVDRSGQPIQKSLEEGIVLSALTLAVNGTDTLVGIYQLLQDYRAVKRIDVRPSDHEKHIFQANTDQAQKIDYGEDVTVNNYNIEDSDVTIVITDMEDARDVQKKLDEVDGHVERINEDE